MEFVHRIVYHLTGINELFVDPWRLTDGAPLAELDSEHASWLSGLRITNVKLAAAMTLDDRDLADLDTKMALANRILDGLLGGSDRQSAKSEGIREIRLKRSTALGTGAWLVVNIAGTYSQANLRLPDLDEELGASFELAQNPSPVSALWGRWTQEFCQRIIGAICLAARHRIHTRLVDRGWWYVRPDGRPHYPMAPSMNARGTVSTTLPADAARDLPQLLDAARHNPRISRAIVAFGQSLEWNLDPTLEFLSAFTALELLTKERTKAPDLAPTNARRGLAKRFEKLAGADVDDCNTFDRLNADRNGLAHEAEFRVPAAEEARRLFEKYMMAHLLPSTDPS